LSDANPFNLFQQSPAVAPQGTIGFQNPLQAMVMGGQVGTTMANNQNIQQGNALVTQQIGQAQEAQKQKQQRIIELSRKIAQGPYAERAADMAELAQLANPENFKQMNEGFKQMSLEQQHTVLKDAGTILSLLYSGDSKRAQSYVSERIEAAKLGNDREALQAYMSAQQLIANNKDPKQAAMQLEYAISPFDGSKEMLENIHSTLKNPSDIAKTEAEAGLNKEKINTERSSQVENYSQARLNDRLPNGGKGAGTDTDVTSSALAEVNSNASMIDDVLGRFETFAAGGGKLGSGMFGAEAFLGDTLAPDHPMTLWRKDVKQALLTPILDKLKQLRPASDVDVKFVKDAVGDVDKSPITALNALYKQKQLLKFYQDSLVASKDYPTKAKKGETLQQYLDRTVPMPKFESNAYGTKQSGLGGVLGIGRTDYTKSGLPITNDKLVKVDIPSDWEIVGPTKTVKK
jgi:hypothetical protein